MWLFAHAYQVTLEVRQTVVLSVLSMLIALWIEAVFLKSAKTLALEPVELVHDAMLSITVQFVIAKADSQEILSLDVLSL